jgi:hypothetical protein
MVHARSPRIRLWRLSCCSTVACRPVSRRETCLCWGVYSQEVTACFTSASFAHHSTARPFVRGLKRWKKCVGYVLPTGPVTVYVTAAGRLLATIPGVRISRPVISRAWSSLHRAYMEMVTRSTQNIWPNSPSIVHCTVINETFL